MKKRVAAVAVAAAAFCGVLPATAALADCGRICLMCDPSGECGTCIEQSVLGRPTTIC